MGSFSWNKADDLTKIENIAYGDSFKFLVPVEFGGGFIKDKYQDYGYLGTKEDGEPKYDMYELIAYNRNIGIDIGCYDRDIDRLKYPLKLVSASFKGSYEDLENCSYGDPDQGFYRRKRQ